jgi:hypothetical protein
MLISQSHPGDRKEGAEARFAKTDRGWFTANAATAPAEEVDTKPAAEPSGWIGVDAYQLELAGLPADDVLGVDELLAGSTEAMAIC